MSVVAGQGHGGERKVTDKLLSEVGRDSNGRIGRQALIHQEPTEYSSNLSHPPKSH